MKNIIIFLIIIIIILLIKNNKNNKNNKKIENFESRDIKYTNQGYAKNTDKWIEPKIYDNFITQEDADYIINYTKNNLEESQILSGLNNEIRKSKTCWIPKDDKVASKIIENVCKLTNYPVANAELLQVVQYEPNGFYSEHHDACCDNNEQCDDFVKLGGQRAITMVIYLTDNFEDGGTKFHNLGVTYKPKKLGGLLFHPLAEGTSMCHPKALHAGVPVKKGIKYIANVWIRENSFN